MSPDDVRLAVLFLVFEGDPGAWVDYLLGQGSKAQIDEDLPMALRVKREFERKCGR